MILNFNSTRGTRIKRALKVCLSAAWWAAVALLALLLVNIIGAKLQGRVPSVLGYSVMNIVSGSMEEEIPTGSYILIKRVNPEDVREGDIICFYSTEPAIYGMPNTHRVVEPPIVTENGIEFVTRGDANIINDRDTAKGDRLIGVYVKRLGGVTSFAEALDGGAMIIIIIALQICIAVMVIMSAVRVKGEENGQRRDLPALSEEDILRALAEMEAKAAADNGVTEPYDEKIQDPDGE